MIRPLVSAIGFVLFTIIGALLALPSGLIDPTGDGVMTLARLWARATLAVAGIRIDVRAPPRLAPARPYVFMANHLSTIDIWAMIIAVPVSFRFIAKKQLGAIPLFGWAMRAGRFIFIDRQNPASARRSIAEAERRIRAGQSVVMYPEGTRSRDGRLAAFKKGGFHLAMNAGAEIVPVAIRGSGALMPPGSARIRPGVVTVDFGEPISTAGLSAADRDALVERVHGRIAELLARQ